MEDFNNIKAFTQTIVKMAKGGGVFDMNPECKFRGTLHGCDFVATRSGDGEITIKFSQA